jgi:hypothetical protein
MPLVGDLTAEIRNWLTAEKLRELNTLWRKQGGGHSDAVIDNFTAALCNPSMNYENLLGHLEVQFSRAGRDSQQYHALYGWLVELVYILLYQRHVLNVDFISSGLRFFEGIIGLAKANNPFWIFSLNHDAMIDCLAAQYGMIVCSGFPENRTLPRRDLSGNKVGELRLTLLPGDQFDKSGFKFLPPGVNGINLLQIHGSLTVFTCNDGRDLAKISPAEQTVSGIIDGLRQANEQLIYIEPGWPRPVKATNEIAYADNDGEMQFLRRTLLAGAHKFDRKRFQVLPVALLEHFRSYLNSVSTLICVGYGFGDTHINQLLKDWLEFSSIRTIEIVGPDAKHLPAFVAHLASQVSLVDSSATNYFERYALTPLNWKEKTARAIRARARIARRKNKGFA